MVSDDHGMLPSVSAKLIRRKVCEKNSVFRCVLAVEMLQDGKQRCTRGYKRYKETSGLIEWKECQIFHSIFT